MRKHFINVAHRNDLQLVFYILRDFRQIFGVFLWNKNRLFLEREALK